MLVGKPIDQAHEEEALKLHRKGVETWKDIWDIDLQYWKSRVTLILEYHLSNHQLNLIGQRIDQWDRGDLWLMTITQKALVDAFVRTDSKSLRPIPKGMETIAIHCVLDLTWKILRQISMDQRVANAVEQTYRAKEVLPGVVDSLQSNLDQQESSQSEQREWALSEMQKRRG